MRSESRLQRITLSPLRVGAVMLFVTAPFMGTAISQFIDCRDAFWSVACGIDAPTDQPIPLDSGDDGADTNSANLTADDDEVLGITVVIDADPTCQERPDGLIVCNS